MEVSSEIPRTFLGPGILKVICSDGSVKCLRGCSTFTTHEELVQEEVQSIFLEEIPVSIERSFKSLEGQKDGRYCLELASFEWYTGPTYRKIIDNLSTSSFSD